MKKIVLSLGMIALVATVAVGATRALFSDTATVSGSTFSTGTMDLRIDSNPSPDYYDWSNGFSGVSFNNLYPGYPTNPGSGEGKEHNWQVIDIMNVGNLDGNATIQLNRTSDWNPLASNLTFTIYYDGGHTGAFVPTGISGTLDAFTGTYTLGPITGTDVGGGKTASVKIVWTVPASAGNDIQGKSVTIDAVFGLEQTVTPAP